jgi:hypothetical protein
MTMRKVWAVSSGEHSDYSVGLLFTSEELAAQHAERMSQRDRYDDHRVEEFQLWDSAPPAYVLHCRRGHVTAGGVNQEQSWTINDIGAPDQPLEVRVSRLVDGGHWLNVAALDPERVAKVWGERVARIRAELAGIG